MTDYRNAKGAVLTPAERDWLCAMSANAAGQFGDETRIIHIGVEYGASLHCSKAGAPKAEIVGVDLDLSKFEGDKDAFTWLEGDSAELGWEHYKPAHLLFIDGDHSEVGVHKDIQAWIHTVKPGGVIAFHDCYQDLDLWPHTAGVRKAIDAWDWAPTAWEPMQAPDSIAAFRRKPYLKRGDGWGTIGIGTPYLKAEYDFFRWWSWLLVGGLEPGDQLINDTRVLLPMPIPASHNGLIARFLATDRDTLCIVEDDHIAEQTIIRQMREKPDNRDFDIVCANYVNRRSFPQPVGYWLQEPNEYGEYTCAFAPPEEHKRIEAITEYSELKKAIAAHVWKTGTQEMDGASFGLVLIRRWVLEAMLGGQDPREYFWCDWRGRNSQDIVFYARAKAVGARVGVDRDANLGHLTCQVRTIQDFWNAMEDDNG